MPKPKKPKKPPIEKTRNGGTWTESVYWAAVRSALRKRFAWWMPAVAAKHAARRPYCGPNKRQKFEYQCHGCGRWLAEKHMHLDHTIPCGSLNGPEDFAGFLARLTPESPAAFQMLCKSKCHQEKTNAERAARKVSP
jgi:hypothetical protein